MNKYILLVLLLNTKLLSACEMHDKTHNNKDKHVIKDNSNNNYVIKKEDNSKLVKVPLYRIKK